MGPKNFNTVFMRDLHRFISRVRWIQSTPRYPNGIMRNLFGEFRSFCPTYSTSQYRFLNRCRYSVTIYKHLSLFVLQKKRKDIIRRREIDMLHRLFREETWRTLFRTEWIPLAVINLGRVKWVTGKCFYRGVIKCNFSRYFVHSCLQIDEFILIIISLK
jgi:hypothetical protein